MIKYIDAIFVPVLNIEESLEWYHKYFGTKMYWRDKQPDWNAAGIGFKYGSMVLLEREFINKSDHIRFNLYTPDAEAFYCFLKENGVEVNSLVHYDTMDCFDCKDPSGNWVGVVGRWEEEGVGSGDFSGPDAIFLPVSDIQKATAWYHSLLGIQFEVSESPDPQFPFRYGFNRISNDLNHPAGLILLKHKINFRNPTFLLTFKQRMLKKRVII